ncbi:uncharacterized protein LOC142317838 [Lycorma delicatula]|uniref:uncharacterized protein LOC142317838 n=1 Tax=Lycorma delicatula TaxID=130591 RepID=UPI003F5109FC
MLAGRIVSEVEEGLGIRPNQYGFWKERSTVQAISKVINWAEESRRGTWRTRQISLMVSLDMKNAFGTIAWRHINMAMEEKRISSYLRRQIEEYLNERRCKIGTQEDEVHFNMSGDVPQGSVLGQYNGSWSLMAYLV